MTCNLVHPRFGICDLVGGGGGWGSAHSQLGLNDTLNPTAAAADPTVIAHTEAAATGPTIESPHGPWWLAPGRKHNLSGSALGEWSRVGSHTRLQPPAQRTSPSTPTTCTTLDATNHPTIRRCMKSLPSARCSSWPRRPPTRWEVTRMFR